MEERMNRASNIQNQMEEPPDWRIEDVPPSYESVMNGSDASNQPLSPSQVIISPQRIQIDGVLISSSQLPAFPLYQLSRDLVAGTRIIINRIDHELHLSSEGSQRPRVRERAIYGFAHEFFDDSTLIISGKRRDGFASLVMVKSRTVKGHIWTVYGCRPSSMRKESVFFVCKSVTKIFGTSNDAYEWQDSIGQVIAVEQKPKSPMDYASLDVRVELDQKIFDLLVTVWCCRVWNHNLKTSGLIRTISKGKNAMGFKS